MASKQENQPDPVEVSVFGPYKVYERLGIGGMASVHRAEERLVDGGTRIVALKRLLPHLAEDEDFVRAFVREARLASMLNHPNIVSIHELGRVKTDYFISMEYVEGRDIRQALKQARRVAGPPPVGVIVSMLSVLCRALHYAHHKKDPRGRPLELVHRDISPANVLISNTGVLKIIDFGIAKATIDQLRTRTGRIKGKLAYMAPEALSGQGLDARSDLWSVGVIAHELACARPLFAAKNDFQTIQRVRRAEVDPPSKQNPNYPIELDAIILKALERKPERRWQNAGEMADALDNLAQQYHLRPSDQQVAQWCDWAFSLGHASQRAATVPTSNSIEEALEAVALDESVVEEAWGSHRQEASPVVLLDVPDVSHRIGSTTSGEIRAATGPLAVDTVLGPPMPESTVTIADSSPTVTDVELTSDIDDDEEGVTTNVRDPSGVDMIAAALGDEATSTDVALNMAEEVSSEMSSLPVIAEGSGDSMQSNRAPTMDMRRATQRRLSIPPPPAGEPRITFHKSGETAGLRARPPISAPNSAPIPAPPPLRNKPLPAAAAPTGPTTTLLGPAPRSAARPARPQHSGAALATGFPNSPPLTAPAITLPPSPPNLDKRPESRTPRPRPDHWAAGTTPPPFDVHAPDTGGLPPITEGALPTSIQRSTGWSITHWLLLGIALISVIAIALIFSRMLSRSDADADSLIAITTEPSGASIEVDGVAAQPPLSLAPGKYGLKVHHEGFEPYETTIEVAEGQNEQFRIALSKIALPEKAASEPKKTQTKPSTHAVSDEIMRRKKGGSPLVMPGARGRDRIRVLICIDEAGTVASASVISDVPRKWRAPITSALATWTYEPYKVQGIATPACFESYPKLRK